WRTAAGVPGFGRRLVSSGQLRDGAGWLPVRGRFLPRVGRTSAVRAGSAAEKRRFPDWERTRSHLANSQSHIRATRTTNRSGTALWGGFGAPTRNRERMGSRYGPTPARGTSGFSSDSRPRTACPARRARRDPSAISVDSVRARCTYAGTDRAG